MQSLAEHYRTLFLPDVPEKKAIMQPATSPHKYNFIHAPITTRELADHLAGRRTFATPLVASNGLARCGALDIDAGGKPALTSCLHHCQIRGITAVAITSSNEDHDGGHIWVLFAAYHDPERVRALMQQIAAGAGVEAETYPTGKNLRLPLGVHTWTKKRGILLFQDGQEIDLDAEPTALTQALAAIAALPLNQGTALPAPIVPTAPPPRAAPITGDPIGEYNQQTDLISLFLSYGARIYKPLSDGGAVLHCCCGNHKHHDRTASLEVRPSRNPRNGRFIAYGYSPVCDFFTERGQVINAFTAFCKLNGYTAREGVKAITNTSNAQQAGSKTKRE